jgi:hypothetical protein
MSNVISFGRSFTCSEINPKHVDEAQERLNDLLRQKLIACPTCTGRGVYPYKHPITGEIAFARCPCGGTAAERIDFDFGGAA